MTKLRAPLTFAAAIHTVADLIGYDECARLTDRADRTVREWSDSEKTPLPTLEQAFALDKAFICAGGGYAPIFESYERQIEVAQLQPLACRAQLAELVAMLSRETGDALARIIEVLQSDATPSAIYRAMVETEELAPLMTRILGLLTALLPGNGVGPEATGDQN